MPILNYTTRVSIEKTVTEMQKKLAMANAKAILCEYEKGIIVAMSFQIETKEGLISFRLPAKIEGVYSILENNKKVPRRLVTRGQATRVAWRILKDWLEAQLAIVEAGIAELPEVFLPYAQNHDGKTIYDAIKDNGMKMIAYKGKE